VGGTNGSSDGSTTAESSTRRFGVFELDLRAGELRRNGIRIKLQEQPFQILAQLLENPGEVVTREDLRNRLWPADTFVDFDHSLNAAIKRLRNALSDSAENPTFIETIARRGYRFLAPVTANGNGSSAAPVEGIHPVSPETVIPIPARHGLHPYGWWILAAGAAVLLLIGLKVGLSLGQQHSAPQPQAMRVSRLTANPAEDHVRAAAISRDGKYLAFSDETGFYLRQIDTGETHPVTLPAGMTVGFVSWFPDSVHLIVSLAGAATTSGLWEISALGGTPRQLSAEGRAPAVSPDGKTIAFISGTAMRNQIWLMDADGTQPHRLVGEDGDFFGALAWSPDGAKIVYNRGRFGYAYYLNATIELIDVRSRRVSRPFSLPIITQGWYSSLQGPLAWSPDGHLIYTLGETPPRQLDSNLWSIAVDPGGNPTSTPLRLTNDIGEVTSVSTSADGKRIAYVKGVPQPDVYVAKLEGQGSGQDMIKISEPQRLTLDDRQDMPFDWTLDGKSVIFISDRTGLFSIYRQGIDQTIPELLAGGDSPLLSPRLTPDGSQILYLVYPNWSAKAVSSISVMRMPVSGGAPQKVLEGDWISNLQCTRVPATVCLYSTERDGALTLFRFDPLTGNSTQAYQIKDQVAQLYNWSLSPNGSAIAITRGKMGGEDAQVRLVPLDGGAEKTMQMQGATGVSGLDWAADSKSLWASSIGDEENALLNIDLQGRARVVWRPKKMVLRWAIPSRDGRHLALHVSSTSANVWMLER
jgi:Tol biopolymer transport system component/DNA-binding winged helix-turn-helix (wHTH) protein